jgi:CheY-like chemotaxis protein
MGKTINVLIVEDKADKACLMKIGLLDTFGTGAVSILIKKSVPEAEEVILRERNHFQLVMLDGDLNGYHGDELIPVIRNNQEGCVIAACSDRPEMNLRMMEKGADITTEKDFANAQFADIRKKLFELVMKPVTT